MSVHANTAPREPDPDLQYEDDNIPGGAEPRRPAPDQPNPAPDRPDTPEHPGRDDEGAAPPPNEKDQQEHKPGRT